MRTLRHALTVTAVAVAALCPPALAQAPAPATKIGFIDVQRVLVRSAAGVAAREELEREKALMQREIDAKLGELKTLREELEKKGALMTAAARGEKQDAFERKQRDAARLADDFQKELAKKEQLMGRRVLQELDGIIARLGKERGLTLILESRTALYVAHDADLTDEVIRTYDQQAAAAKGKK